MKSSKATKSTEFKHAAKSSEQSGKRSRLIRKIGEKVAMAADVIFFPEATRAETTRKLDEVSQELNKNTERFNDLFMDQLSGIESTHRGVVMRTTTNEGEDILAIGISQKRCSNSTYPASHRGMYRHRRRGREERTRDMWYLEVSSSKGMRDKFRINLHKTTFTPDLDILLPVFPPITRESSSIEVLDRGHKEHHGNSGYRNISSLGITKQVQAKETVSAALEALIAAHENGAIEVEVREGKEMHDLHVLSPRV